MQSVADYVASPEEARKHFLAWGNYITRGKFKVYPHTKRISDAVIRAVTGKNKSRRLAVEIPPQHGKTELISKTFPTWWLGRHPDQKVAIVTYGQDYSNKLNGHNRNTFSEFGRQVFGYDIDRSTNAKEYFCVKGHLSGGIVATGSQGQLNGQTCHGVIFDDPYKSAKQANSPTVRAEVMDFFRMVASTRVTPESWIIVLHTRWHADDLIGTLRRENIDLPDDEKWEFLRLPAIATTTELNEDGTVFRREGEALWPAQKPIDFLERQERTMGKYAFNCLYQQVPGQFHGAAWAPELFDESIWIPKWPSDMWNIVVAIDPAGGGDIANSDYPAIVALGVRGDGYFYSDAYMERGSPKVAADNLAKFVEQLPVEPIGVFCESVLLKELYIEQIAKSMAQKGKYVTVYPIETGGVKKEDRIMRLDPHISGREIRFVHNRHTDLVVQQLKNFPHRQEHDDGPDALEMAFRGLSMTSKFRGFG